VKFIKNKQISLLKADTKTENAIFMKTSHQNSGQAEK